MTIQNELYSAVDKAKKYDELLKIQGKFEALSCSFCGKSQDDVRKLVAGQDVYICNECIELCNEIIAEEEVKDGQGDESIN